MLRRCECGSDPTRRSRRTRKGMRWWVECPRCHKKTVCHRPNGGDIHDWNSRKVS